MSDTLLNAVQKRRHLEIASEFHLLSRNQKVFVLARVTHYETIRLHDSLACSPVDTDEIQAINNSIHRLSGYMMSTLLKAAEFDRDRSFIQQLLVELEERRGHEIRWIIDWIVEARTCLR